MIGVERQGWLLPAVFTLITGVVMGLFRPRQVSKVRAVKEVRPKSYDDGLSSLMRVLTSDEQLRLLRVDSLFERYFDNGTNDFVVRRKIGVLLDEALTYSRDLQSIEAQLVELIPKAAGSEINEQAGLAATVELMVLLRMGLRRMIKQTAI